MKWNRRQYLDYMLFRDAPRPMFSELFGPLVGLAEEWRSQGASQDEIDMVGFDWDYVPVFGVPTNLVAFGGPAPVVLEDTAEYRITRDSLGRRMKLIKATATIPLPLDYPVGNMDDWLKLKPLYLFDEGRIDYPQLALARQAQADGELVVTCVDGAFDLARALMGDEGACLAYYDQPELMHDILDTVSRMNVEVFERVSRYVIPDQVTFSEDLAGRTGPLVGPRQVQEYVGPYYRTACEFWRERGTQIFQMDSDGNVNAVIEDFLQAGLNSIYPMEPAAGMDVVALRKKFGKRLLTLGGIDKHVVRKSKPEIRAELEYKMQPAMREGGIVFSLDHRIPNGTPLENYRYYVQTGREILGLPPRDPNARGWARMAF